MEGKCGWCEGEVVETWGSRGKYCGEQEMSSMGMYLCARPTFAA